MSKLIALIITFLAGYLTASVFNLGTFVRWMNPQIQTQGERSATLEKSRQETGLPKPQLQFYTLLTSEQRPSNSSAAHTDVLPKPVAAAQQATELAEAAAAVMGPSKSTKVAPVATVTVNKPPTAPSNTVPRQQLSAKKTVYSVQVASFKARDDAERMRGNLILKGFSSMVFPVSTSKGNWFRVLVGPYSDKRTAQRAQQDLARVVRLQGIVAAGP